jgi:hypothetical protein
MDVHNEKLHNWHSSQNNVREIKSRMKCEGWNSHREKRNVYRILVQKPQQKRPFGRQGHMKDCY